MIAGRNFSCKCRVLWDQICLAGCLRPIKLPPVSRAGCQKVSLHSGFTNPTTESRLFIGPPYPASTRLSTPRTASASATFKAIGYPFCSHRSAGGKRSVAHWQSLCSFNWYSISDCHLKNNSLAGRHQYLPISIFH